LLRCGKVMIQQPAAAAAVPDSYDPRSSGRGIALLEGR